MAYAIRQTPQAQLYDLPIIGDDLANIGRVIDLYSVPCKPTAEIWVYGFFQAIPTLFITLTKPELVDIDIKKGSHRPRKGRKARFRAAALFRDALVTIPVPRWVVFRVFEWTQRIGWYFLVADALEDFAINWISMAYIYNGCSGPPLVYASWTASNLQEGSSLTPQSRRLVWTAAGVSNVNIDSTTARPIIPGAYRCSWDCTFSPYAVPSQSQLPFTTYCVVNGVAVAVGEAYQASSTTRRATGSTVIDYFGPPAPTVQIHGAWQNSAKFCRMSGRWDFSLIRPSELGPDP